MSQNHDDDQTPPTSSRPEKKPSSIKPDLDPRFQNILRAQQAALSQNSLDSSLEPNPIIPVSPGDLTAPNVQSTTGHQSSQKEAPEVAGFQLLEKVGEGNFGTVWKAFDNALNRIVAIKFPRGLGARTLKRFKREAHLVAQLQHPNIVGIHEFAVDAEPAYLVCEFIDGLTLSDWGASFEPNFDEIAKMALTLAETMQFAHDSGVIHRDLKPGNVIVDWNQQPHILDFGLAKGTAYEDSLTMTGMVIGTPAYMSPEQARSEQSLIGPTTDIYSIGMMLYELLTHELPFRGTNKMLLHQIQFEDPTPPRSLDHRVPKDLETICLKCLVKQPNRRFTTAGELAEDLKRFLENKPLISQPPSALRRTIQWCQRNKLATVTTAAITSLLLLGMLGAFSWAYKISSDSVESSKFLYSLTMSKIQTQCERGQLDRAQQLLDTISNDEELSKLRGWDWHYWNQFANGSEEVGTNSISTVIGDYGESVAQIEISPEGDRIVITGSSDNATENSPDRLMLINLENNESVFKSFNGRPILGSRTFPKTEKIAAIVKSPNSKNNPTIVIWDFKQDAVVAELKPEMTSPDLLAISGDEATLFVACSTDENTNQPIKAFDLETRQPIEFEEAPHTTTLLAWVNQQDSETEYLLTIDSKSNLQFRNANTSSIEKELSLGNSTSDAEPFPKAEGYAVSSSSNSFAIGFSDGLIKLIDLKSFTPTRTLHSDSVACDGLCFIESDETLCIVTCSSKKLALLDIESNVVRTELPLHGSSISCAASYGQKLFTADETGEIRMHDVGSHSLNDSD